MVYVHTYYAAIGMRARRYKYGKAKKTTDFRR
jgi:hypothetical protein